jgi:hypothetical protein
VSHLQPGAKIAMAARSPHDLRGEARHALQEALRLAQDFTTLASAADLLEEAISKDPALRERYDAQLQLWRKGIMPVSTAPLQRFTPQTTLARKIRSPSSMGVQPIGCATVLTPSVHYCWN